MMRVSATQLELFRLYRDPDQDWLTEAEVLASLRGEPFEPNERVRLGKAFDEILEHPDRFRVFGGYKHGEFAFDDEVMNPCLDVFDRRGVFQVKATKVYGDVTVSAVADQLIGARLVENKTTLSTFAFDKYEASYQWRFMAEVFVPAIVTYNVFCLGQDYNGYISLRSIETFNLYPYPDLHADCVALVEEFRQYAHARGLVGTLTERQARAEAAA